MSDDISIVPRGEAALESNRRQQIVPFVYISINGHDEEELGGGNGKTYWDETERERVQVEDDGERPWRCCVSSLSRVLFYHNTQTVRAGIRRAAGHMTRLLC